MFYPFRGDASLGILGGQSKVSFDDTENYRNDKIGYNTRSKKDFINDGTLSNPWVCDHQIMKTDIYEYVTIVTAMSDGQYYFTTISTLEGMIRRKFKV